MNQPVNEIIFTGLGRVACEAGSETPTAPRDGALLQTRYSCISAGTEIAKLTGKQSFPYPAGIGNRAVARVVETGPDCGRVRPGDLVFAHTAHASAVATNGMMVRLPDALDRPEAALIGMASVAITGVRVAQPELGDTAVVLGAGLVGQFAAQLLALNGIRVILVDPVAERLETARRCGIADVIDSSARDVAWEVMARTRGEGAEHVLDCTGAPDVIATSPALAKTGGQIVMVGSPRGAATESFTDFLNAFHLYRDHGDLTLRGAHEWKIPTYPVAGVKHSQERNIHLIGELILAGRLRAETLLSRVFDPKHAQEAYDGLIQSPGSVLGAVFDWSRCASEGADAKLAVVAA